MPIDPFPSSTGFLTPKARSGIVPHTGYRGVFARSRILRGELLAVWGGEIMVEDQVLRLTPDLLRLALQVDEALYIVSSREGPADWINHSCNPNAGLSGQISLVSLRDIERNEEICFDYAMTDGSPYDEFECRCGARTCRHRVTGNDWQLASLRIAYGGHFSPYLQRRQERLPIAPELPAPPAAVPAVHDRPRSPLFARATATPDAKGTY